MKFSLSLVFSVVLATSIMPLATGALEAQELSDEQMEAILQGGTFEVGRTRVARPAVPATVAEPAPARADSTAQNPAAASPSSGDPALTGASLFEAVSQAVAESGAPVGMGLGGGLGGGLARSLMGLAGGTGDAGDTAGPSGLENTGLGLTRSLLEAATGAAANGGASPLPGGASAGLVQQLGQMMGIPVPSAPTPAPGSTGEALDGARALLDAYGAARSAPVQSVEIPLPSAATPVQPEAAPPAEPTPARTAPTRESVRAVPGRPNSRDRDDEEDEEDRALPWASGFQGSARADAADDAPPSARRNMSRPAPRTAPSAAPPAAPIRSTADATADPATEARTDAAQIRESQPRIAPRAAPADLRSTEASPAPADVAAYDDAVASRAGDWFVVLGSYRIHAGADPLPSADLDGSSERSTSAAIAGAQERLWDAGYTPWVVRSDAVPSFQDGFAVIVVGPLPRDEAAAQVDDLREIVPDAYIKAGW